MRPHSIKCTPSLGKVIKAGLDGRDPSRHGTLPTRSARCRHRDPSSFKPSKLADSYDRAIRMPLQPESRSLAVLVGRRARRVALLGIRPSTSKVKEMHIRRCSNRDIRAMRFGPGQPERRQQRLWRPVSSFLTLPMDTPPTFQASHQASPQLLEGLLGIGSPCLPRCRQSQLWLELPSLEPMHTTLSRCFTADGAALGARAATCHRRSRSWRPAPISLAGVQLLATTTVASPRPRTRGCFEEVLAPTRRGSERSSTSAAV